MKKLKYAICVAILIAVYYTPVHAAEKPEMIEVPEEIIALSEAIGAEYGICPELLQAIAWKESRFTADAKNGSCIGLMQINEPYHGDRMDKLGVTDLTDPEQSMRVAADYIAELAGRYEDIGIVLMVYNGFPKAEDYVNRTGKLSKYATDILELSEKLETRRK
jgi:soluble lytic murein transglycosylase-like protein